MSAFSCPKCNGKCCRDVVYGHRRTHWAANEYAHDCAFCHDGTVPVRTAEDERAAVVAWLREAAYTTLYDARAWDVADAIERGDHRRKVEP